MTNVTGFNELIAGNVITAVYVKFNTVFLGWIPAFLLLALIGAVFYKTKDPLSVAVTILIPMALFYRYFPVTSLPIFGIILIMALGGLWYRVANK